MATFGYNTIGGTTGGLFSGGSFVGSWFTAPENGTITKIWVRAQCPFTPTTDPLHVAIYDRSSGAPLNLLAESSVAGAVGTAFDWYGADISYVMTSGEQLYLAAWIDGAYNIQYDAGSTNQSFEKFSQTFNNWEDPINSGTNYNQYNTVISIYAEYTPAASAVGKMPSTYIGGTYIGGTWLIFEQGAISATYSGTSDFSATIKAKGQLSATFSGTSSFNAIIKGKALLQANYSGTSNFEGTGRLKANISATYSGTSNFSATITGKSYMSASYSGTSDFSGIIKGKGKLIAAYSGTSQLTGSLIGKGALSSVYSGNSNFAGAIGGRVSISATYSGTCDFTGNLSSGIRRKVIIIS